MVLTQIIDNLTKWIQENICAEVKFLKPDEAQNGAGYKVEYVNPKAFPLYIPAKDLLPPDTETKLPAVCVQLVDGKDDLTKGEEILHVRLAFAVWRYGTYEEIEEEKDGETITRRKFKPSMDGWKDLWTFVDKAKTTLQKNMYIEGLKIDRKEPMKFGFFSNDEAMVNAYPEWYAWLSFAVKCGTVAVPVENYQEYL